MTELRNHQILEFKFKIFEKIKKIYKNYVKKLDQIIRTLVKKKFQISTVLLDKI
jgi:predicted nucleic acid-binding protein